MRGQQQKYDLLELILASSTQKIWENQARSNSFKRNIHHHCTSKYCVVTHH